MPAPCLASTVRRLRLTALAASLAFGLPATAQGPDSPEAASAPASAASSAGSSLFKSIGGFFKSLTQPKAGDSAASAPAGEAAGETASAAAAPASAASGVAFRLIDIDSWSTTADVVLDPHCKTPVQPFGLSDNMGSLAVLAAKLKITGFLGGLTKNGQPPPKVKDIVKVAARQLNWLPMELEQQIGEQAIPQDEILDENKNKDSRRTYADARAMLDSIVKTLPQPLPYQFRLLVSTKSFNNATALPGGIIVVDRDLFKKGADADYAYFVMGHEVAHVLQRHQTRAYQARLVDGLDSVESLSKFISQTTKPDVKAVVGYASALKKLFVNFSDQQELQADSCALRIMAGRYPEPKQLQARVGQVLKRMGPGAATTVANKGPASDNVLDHLQYLTDGVLESHPNSHERRTNLEAVLRLLTTSGNAGGSAPPPNGLKGH